MRRPLNSMGATEVCVICQLPGLADFQITLPVARSTATSRASPPVARITRLLSTSGHCPAYQGGTSALNSRTRFICHFNSPLRESTQMTWHFGLIATTYGPATVGTVRDMPWLRLTLAG